MVITVMAIYSLLAICLIWSLLKSRQKTKQSFKVAAKALWKMAPG